MMIFSVWYSLISNMSSLVGMIGDSCSEGCGFESLHWIENVHINLLLNLVEKEQN